MDYANELKIIINVLSGLCPRVDQVNTIARPIAYCVDKLADIHEDMIKQANSKSEEAKE